MWSIQIEIYAPQTNLKFNIRRCSLSNSQRGMDPTPRGSSFGLGFGSISQDSLYPSHLSILQHHFDAVWMRGALGQNARDNTGRQCPSALILLLDNLHPQTGVDFTTLGCRHKLILSPSYHREWRSSANCVSSRHVKSEGHASSWPRYPSRPVIPTSRRSVPLEIATHQERGTIRRELDYAARNPIYQSIARRFAFAYPNRTSARQAVPRFGAISAMRRISRTVPIGSETSSPDCWENRKGGCDPA